MKRSKRYKKAKEFIELKTYTFKEAFDVLKLIDTGKSRTVDLSISLDSSKIKQFNMRGFFKMPNIFKICRLAVVNYELSESLKNNKDILFLNIDELAKITSQRNKKTWGFDKLLLNSKGLEKIKHLAKKLSIKKCFPNLKDGTLFTDEKYVEDYLTGKTELKADKEGNFHVSIGRTDFSYEKLEENFKEVLSKVNGLKPSNWKGGYIKNLTLSTTMSPGIRI